MRPIDGDHICKILAYLKRMEYDERDEAYNSAIDDCIAEVANASVLETLPVKIVNIDDYINRECTITLKDGRTFTGKLSVDSRYLNIVDSNTNEPISFYGKDISLINGNAIGG